MHTFRWDLDRTYLETEIHSVRGLVRAAFEPASEKRTVPGAAALLRALAAHDPAAQVFVLSGSPTQMRTVLLEKLRLDGVRVDQLVLKDNLRNLRKGRIHAVLGQIGYKLPQLLRDRAARAPTSTETLFGDDSESDAAIYATYAAAIAGRIGEAEVREVLEIGRAYPDAVQVACEALRRIQRFDAVQDIFIRLDKGVPPAHFRPLGPIVIPVFSWLQAALVLFQRDRLSASDVARVASSSAAEGAQGALEGLVQDAVRRGLVTENTLDRLSTTDGIADLTRAALRALGPHEFRAGARDANPDDPVGPVDFPAFLRNI